jgi:hypothetical protein
MRYLFATIALVTLTAPVQAQINRGPSDRQAGGGQQEGLAGHFDRPCTEQRDVLSEAELNQKRPITLRPEFFDSPLTGGVEGAHGPSKRIYHSSWAHRRFARRYYRTD